MTRTDWQELVEQLHLMSYQFGLITPDSPVHRIDFDPGLTNIEVAIIEGRYGFKFPPDLRAFLQTALPNGPKFPNWRLGDEVVMRDWLDIPKRGVLFDVESNGFWLDQWGPRPALLIDALCLTRCRLMVCSGFRSCA